MTATRLQLDGHYIHDTAKQDRFPTNTCDYFDKMNHFSGDIGWTRMVNILVNAFCAQSYKVIREQNNGIEMMNEKRVI